MRNIDAFARSVRLWGILTRMPDLTYISPGNEKTECFSFDIPAKVTCPGMTESCGKLCYAFKLAQVYRNVGAKHQRNLEFANTDKFVMHMIREIPRRCEFRIHVSGDFYSAEYVAKWRKIIAARPDVTFYTYTRSWQTSAIWSLLLKLHENFENVNINLSVDSDTGAPRVFAASVMRWCYLTNDDTAPDWLRQGDIIFRSNHTARPGGHKWKRKKAIRLGQDPDKVAPLIHKIGKATVCPLERGRNLPKSFSCARCHLCVDKPKVLASV